MGVLVLGRRDHPNAGVEPWVVVSLDPAGSGVLDVGDGSVGPVVEDGGADALGLVQAIHRFHQGVDAPIAVKQPVGSSCVARGGALTLFLGHAESSICWGREMIRNHGQEELF